MESNEKIHFEAEAALNSSLRSDFSGTLDLMRVLWFQIKLYLSNSGENVWKEKIISVEKFSDIKTSMDKLNKDCEHCLHTSLESSQASSTRVIRNKFRNPDESTKRTRC